MCKALLLVDIQNDYFAGGKNELVEPENALKSAVEILTVFRTLGLPVIHIQHISLRKDATFFLPNTWGVEIHPALTPQTNEDIVIKHTPNSFFETNLNDIICEKGITELVVGGMMTHMCIDTTVRAAKDYAIPVTLLSDACATKDLTFNEKTLPAVAVNNVYFASLDKMFAKVVSVGEFLKTLA